MKPTLISCLFFLCTLSLSAQNKDALKYASFIDSVQLHTYLSRLASDEFEGRKTGTVGETVSAYYIADKLRGIAVPSAWDSTYFQGISMYKQVYIPKKFQLGDANYTKDYSYYNDYGQPLSIQTDQVYFIGYGAVSDSYNDLKPVGDIQGKVVLMFSGEPSDKDGVSYISGDRYGQSYWLSKVKEQKPQAILLVSYDGSTYYDNYASGSRGSTQYERKESKDVPVVNVSEILANKLLESLKKTVKQIRYEIEKTGKPQSVIIKETVEIGGERKYDFADSKNVVGFVEGSDLKDEYIVLTAHYDHEGKSYYRDDIYNGADDNASGVSALLEIANAFATAKKAGKGTRRSIIFLFTTAEESGMYGSDYYTEYPIFPLKNTKACINLDMIGRVSTDYESITNDYVYLVHNERRSGDLAEVTKEVSKGVKLTVDYSYSGSGDKNNFFGRSDQYNFATKDVPSVLFTSGMHDDYHKTTDDVERINFGALQKRAQLVFLLTWEVANRENVKIGVVDVKGISE